MAEPILPDVLAAICAYKREEIAARMKPRPSDAVEAAARAASPPLGFAEKLEAVAARTGYGLIGEIKRTSPSLKGKPLRPDFARGFDPASLARAYAKGGAACLSVLTDAPSFQGEDSYLAAARDAAELPVLRKDFMLDPYQISESRALGADCVLLIMAALDDSSARKLADAAIFWGMDALVEVHDEAELERALALPCRLVGVNNRNLKTLQTDLATTERLAPRVPDDRILVCESGLKTPADLARMASAGARCFLVGESLMAQPDLEAATRALLAKQAPRPAARVGG
ncbi:MAG TPA: indole-3-glycerol phosphate synthase TrpC [Alphaproteobacteria bacterium]|nr:indole-3-glycerol phosphate synthase TrpC [Alphaproteobacteria bacterium]